MNLFKINFFDKENVAIEEYYLLESSDYLTVFNKLLSEYRVSRISSIELVKEFNEIKIKD